MHKCFFSNLSGEFLEKIDKTRQHNTNFFCKVLRIWEYIGGFLSSSWKKLSTFEFLFFWQNRTFILTENQRTLSEKPAAPKLWLQFSQWLQKCAKIQMFSTPCWSVTCLGLSFFKILTTLSVKDFFLIHFELWIVCLM